MPTKQVIIRIAAIIAAVEFLVMPALHFIPFEIDTIAEAALDGALLAIVSTPLIYIWIIKPFVNDRDEALAQVSHLAFTDLLTQLANRRHIMQHLERVIAGGFRHQIIGALLVIDLDGFRQINDTHGHDAGDAVLAEIAKRFVASIRAEDIAGRMGGDEFVVLVDHLDIDERSAEDKALRIADRLINLAGKPFDYNGQALRVGASVGICLLGLKHLDVDAAISKADIAMHRAKKMGKGCAIFSE